MKESIIEKKVCEYAKNHGFLTFKFMSNFSGVPDRIFIFRGVIVFIEFKTRSGVLSKIQSRTISEMRNHCNVFVVRSENEGIAIVDDILNHVERIKKQK